MDDVDSGWQDFENALRAWIEDFAETIRKAGLVTVTRTRWRRSNPGQFFLAARPELSARDVIYGSAFHLPSFEAVRSAASQSPIGSYLNRPIGPRSSPYTVNLEDFALRTADRAMSLPDQRTVTFDYGVVRRRVSDLRSAIERETVESEILVLIRGLWLQGCVPFADDVSLRALTDDEIVELVQLGLIAPRFGPSGFSPYGVRRDVVAEVQVRGSERVALIRRIPEQNAIVAQGTLHLHIDTHAIAMSDMRRLGDAIAIIGGDRIDAIGWRHRSAATTLANAASFNPIDPVVRPSHFTETGFDANQHKQEIALRWSQLERAEREAEGLGLRLACRRLGFAVGRREPEDQLIDAAVALEAMLLAGEEYRRDIGGLLAQRASWIWPAGHPAAGPKDVSKFIRAAYDFRNRIVHGNRVDREGLRRASEGALRISRAIAGALLDRRSGSTSYQIDWDRERDAFRRARGAVGQTLMPKKI